MIFDIDVPAMVAPSVAQVPHSRFSYMDSGKIIQNVTEFLRLSSIESFEPEEFPPRNPPAIPMWDRAHRKQVLALKAARKQLCDDAEQFNFNAAHIHSAADQISSSIRLSIFDARRRFNVTQEFILESHAREIAHARDYTINLLSCSYFKTIRDLKRTRKEMRLTAAATRDNRIRDLVHARDILHRHITMVAVAECDLIWHPEAATYDGKFQGSFSRAPVEAYQLVRATEEVDGLYHLNLFWLPASDATHRPSEMLIHRGLSGEYAYSNVSWVSRGTLGVTGAVENSYPVRITVMDDYVAQCQASERADRERKVMLAEDKKRSERLWARLFWKKGEFFKRAS